MKVGLPGGVVGVMTDAKNPSVSALITPSATPVVLLNVRMRPVTWTTNCVGPAAPIVSGGNAPVSVSVAPVKLGVETVCGAAGAMMLLLSFAPLMFLMPLRTGTDTSLIILAAGLAFGSCGKFERSGSSCSII